MQTKFFKSTSNSYIFLSYLRRSYNPVVPSKTRPNSWPKWAKCIPVFRPKGRAKNPTRWGDTYLYGLYKGFHPGIKSTLKSQISFPSYRDIIRTWMVPLAVSMWHITGQFLASSFNWKFLVVKAALGSKRKAPRTASSRKLRVAASYGEPFFKGVNTNGLLQNTQQTSVTNGLHMPKRCQNMLDRLWSLILIRAILVRLFAILTLHIWFKVMPFQDSSSNAFNWNIAFLLATTFLCYAIVVPYMPDFEGAGGGGKG